MGQTVGAHILERLHGHGVRLVHGYPGDGINGILGAFHDSELEFVQTAHEELAAFMACAHAKFSDDVGVCLATSGPGAIHLLNGLYDPSPTRRCRRCRRTSASSRPRTWPRRSPTAIRHAAGSPAGR